MLEVDMIKVNDKYYSVKTDITFANDKSNIRMRIVSVNEIDKTGKTTYTKLKTVFSSDEGIQFNTVKYKNIFNSITQYIGNKYKIYNIKYVQ